MNRANLHTAITTSCCGIVNLRSKILVDQMQSALSAVGIYIALNFLILIWIANAIGILRRKHRIPIGHGENEHLERTMRGHANAAENIPIFLIGLTVAAMVGMPTSAVHILGMLFTIGRAMHAYYFIQEKCAFRVRIVGFAISLLMMIVLFAGLLLHGLFRLF